MPELSKKCPFYREKDCFVFPMIDGVLIKCSECKQSAECVEKMKGAEQ